MTTIKRACRPDLTLFLSSTHGEGSSHDFTINYNTILRFDPNSTKYIKLHELSMTYSWYNINSDYNNNSISYTYDNSGTEETNSIAFESGSYSYSDINRYIQSKLEENGHDPEGITIMFDSVEL